jgi:hypothetical protein
MVRMRFGGQIVKFERCRCHDQRFTNALLYIDDMFERVFPRPLHSKLGEGDYACAVGGAVAAWASSGLSDSSSQATLDQAMVTALFGRDSLTMLRRRLLPSGRCVTKTSSGERGSYFVIRRPSLSKVISCIRESSGLSQ